MEPLLAVRKQRKKPDFVRQDMGRPRLKAKWRQPKGMHSKLRRKFKSRGQHPSIGYRAPLAVRGLNNKGLREVVIKNITDLSKVTSKEVILFSKSLGQKKKVELLKKAQELQLNVYNIKDVVLYLKNVEEELKKRKESKKQLLVTKEQAQKEALKKAEKKKEKQESTEEKEKREKEEKRKIMEQPQ